MSTIIPFKRLIFRAVLRKANPMVIRLISVSDQLNLEEFHAVFQTILGWSGDVGYIFRIHGKDYNGFRRRRNLQTLRDFHLQCHEKFLYTCDVVDLWEWDMRVLDIQDGGSGDDAPLCLGGRGATPPEFCGGSTWLPLDVKTPRGWFPDKRFLHS